MKLQTRFLVHLGAALVITTQPLFAQQLTLEEVWSFEGDPIPWLAGMAAVEGGYWAVESFSRKLLFIPEDGGSVEEVGLPGLDEPLLLGGGPHGIAIYDGGDNEILVYRGRRLLRSFPLSNTVFFPKNVLATDDSTVVLAAGLGGSGFGLHILRAGDGRSRHLLPLQNTLQPLVAKMITGGMLALDTDGVLFAQAAPHLIARLDIDRGDLDSIASHPEVLPPVGDEFLSGDQGAEGSAMRWFYPQARGVGRLPDGSIFHVIRRQEEGTSLWELYDREGRLVVRTEVDRAYDVWEVLDDGTLLASYYTDGPLSVPVRLRLLLGR